MEKGDIVKLSQAGLDYIYPVHNWRRSSAEKRRWSFCKITKDGSASVRRLTSHSYWYFHPSFIEVDETY
jgi:hypothetical protein